MAKKQLNKYNFVPILAGQKMTLYDFAYDFLIANLSGGVDNGDVNHLLFNCFRPFNSISNVYESLIISAQNKGQGGNAINYDENRSLIEQVLCGFNVNAVLNTYFDHDAIYKYFRSIIKFNVRPKLQKPSHWQKYAKTAYDGAKFLSRFGSLREFKDFVSSFNINYVTRERLADIISDQVYGLGFCLACDFLKESGYIDYPKPDQYVKNACKLLYSHTDDHEVYRDMIRLTEICKFSSYAKNPHNVNPYSLDKILWLIGSGNFYNVKIQIQELEAAFLYEVANNINRLIY
jgi:hypothetical protein